VTRQLIEFHTKPEMLSAFPQPMPANRAVPKWLRAMPTENGPATPTVKRCPPFLEAMTAGYIIPLPADVHLIHTGSALQAKMVDFNISLVDMHMQDQFPGAPFGNAPLVKFRCPWIIKTPPGYSTLIVPPLNRFGSAIMPLSGVVETDTYYRAIAFPSICLLQPRTEVVLKRGTPLVQVIPFRREEWGSQAGAWDAQSLAGQEDLFADNPHMYRDEHWKKKVFG